MKNKLAIAGAVLATATIFGGIILTSNTVKLAWKAPTTNADGSELTDLAGFKVYYSENTPVTKQDPSEDVGLFLNYDLALPEENKEYHVAATAYDDVGNESDFSNEVQIDKLPPSPPTGCSWVR